MWVLFNGVKTSRFTEDLLRSYNSYIYRSMKTWREGNRNRAEEAFVPSEFYYWETDWESCSSANSCYFSLIRGKMTQRTEPKARGHSWEPWRIILRPGALTRELSTFLWLYFRIPMDCDSIVPPFTPMWMWIVVIQCWSHYYILDVCGKGNFQFCKSRIFIWRAILRNYMWRESSVAGPDLHNKILDWVDTVIGWNFWGLLEDVSLFPYWGECGSQWERGVK